jgi:hypothetical protein
MTSTKLRDWLEILGIFAVVASLIFVGLEMRQSHEIALSQTYQSRTAAAVEWNTAFAANELAMSAYIKAAEGNDDISPLEREALRRTMLAVFFLFDNAYYQYQQGYVSEEFWLSTRESMKNLMSHPAANEIFLHRLRTAGRPDFRDVVLEVNEELDLSAN